MKIARVKLSTATWSADAAIRQAEDDAQAQKIYNALPARQREFFRELIKLCAEFKVEIRGCGCCGSPHVSAVEYVEVKKGQLSFNGGNVRLKSRKVR